MSCACILYRWFCFCVLYYIENSRTVSVFQAQGVRKNPLELEIQRKDKKRQEEEVTEELKRFTAQKEARGFSLFEEALFIFEA